MSADADIAAVRNECAKLIDAGVSPLLENGSLPPMWPWWLPLVDAIAERLAARLAHYESLDEHEEGLEIYRVVVGNLRVVIDFVGETVYIDRIDTLNLPLVTQELGNGFLLDRNANDREQVVGVEAIS